MVWEAKLSLQTKIYFWQLLILIPCLTWSQAIISIDPPLSELPQVGQNLTVQVKVDKAKQMMGFQFTLTYDQVALEFVDIKLGDFLPNSAKPPFSQLAGGQIGALTYFATAFGQPTKKTTGVLARIQFKVLKFQPSALKLVNLSLSGIAGKDGISKPISAVGQSGQVVLPADKPPELILFTSPANQSQLSGNVPLRLEYGKNWVGKTLQIFYAVNGSKKRPLAKSVLTDSGKFDLILDTIKQAKFFPSGNYQIEALSVVDEKLLSIAAVFFQLKNLIFISPTPNQAFNDTVLVEWDSGPSLDNQNITLAYAFAGKLKLLTAKPVPVAAKSWEWPTSELPNGNYQLYALLGTQISLSSVPLKIDHTLAKSPRILSIDPVYLDPELSAVQVVTPLLIEPLPKGQVKWEIVENNLEGVAEVVIEGEEVVVEAIADEGDGIFTLVAIDQELTGTGRERSKPVIVEVIVGLLPLIAIETDFGLSIVSPKIGQTFEIMSYVLDADLISQYQLAIQFDPEALKFVQATNGEQVITQTFSTPVEKVGRVLVSAIGEAAEADEPNLVYLTFEVLAIKNSVIEIAEAALIDPDGFSIPYVIDQPIEVQEKAPTLFDFELPSPLPKPTNGVKLPKEFNSQLTNGAILEEKPFTLDLKLFLNKIHPTAITEWFALANEDVDINIDKKSGLATFIPLENFHGSTVIKVGSVGEVDGKEGEVLAQSILNVTPVAEPPLFLKQKPLVVNQGEKGEFDTDDLVFDDDQYNDELTWKIEGSEHLDAFIDIVDLKAYLIVEAKEEIWAGTEEITVIVTDRNKEVDGTNNLTTTGKLKVTVKQTTGPPIFVVNSISLAESAKANSPSQLTKKWQDIVGDNDPVDKLIIKIEENGKQIKVSNQPTKQQLIFTVADNDWHGTETITISATDTDKGKTKQSIQVTVTATKEKPRSNVAKPLRSISNLKEDQLDFQLNLSEYFIDDEDDSTALKYSSDSVENLTVKIEGHTLSLVPAENWHSKLETTSKKIPIKLTIEDTEQQKLTVSINVSVLPKPDEITFSDFNATFEEDQSASINLLDLVESVDFANKKPVDTQVKFSISKKPNQLSVKIKDGFATFSTAEPNWFTKEDETVEFQVEERITGQSKANAKAKVRVTQVLDRPVIASLKIDATPYDEFATRRILLNLRDPDAHWESQKVWVSAFYHVIQKNQSISESPIISTAPSLSAMVEENFKPCVLQNMNLDTKKVEIASIDDIPMEQYTRYTVAWFAGMDDLANIDQMVAFKLVVEDEENRRAETIREIRINNSERKTPQFKSLSVLPVDQTNISLGLVFQDRPDPLPNVRLLFRLSGAETWQLATIRIPGEPASDSISLSTFGGQQDNPEFIWDLRLSNLQQAGQYDLRLVAVSALSEAWQKFTQIAPPKIQTNETNTEGKVNSVVLTQPTQLGNATTRKGRVSLFFKPEKASQILGEIGTVERVTAVAKRGQWYYISSDKDFGFGYLVEGQTRGYLRSNDIILDDENTDEDEKLARLPALRAGEIVAAGPYYDRTINIETVELLGSGLVYQIDPPSRIITPGLVTYNDQFIISFRSQNERSIVESQFLVYTPSGQLIYETNQAEQQNKWWRFIWSGKNQQGSLLPSGAYFYVLSVGYTNSNNFTETERKGRLRPSTDTDVKKGVCVIAR